MIVDYSDAESLAGAIMNRKAVLYFWAPWHEASAVGGSMDQVVQALAAATLSSSLSSSYDVGMLSSSSLSSSLLPPIFARINADDCSSLTQQYDVQVVPTFVLLDAGGNIIERIAGGEDVSEVTIAVQRLVQSNSAYNVPTVPATTTTTMTTIATTAPEVAENLSARLDRLIRSTEVMLFMKGTPSAPRCGFSRQAVELLQSESIPFGSFDILSDDAVRQGLKTHSNWPTFPQLYVKGELIGGLDIMKEMKQEGSLKEQWGVSSLSESSSATPMSLEDRIKSLIGRHRIMLFMKGLPSAPRCGFSRQLVEILDEVGVAYDTFDILQDEDVRQGLKSFSNWPTYPQLYVNGELLGGLDIVKEMKQDGILKDAL